MSLEKFLYTGPIRSGVNFGRGKNARSVQLVPGKMVDLDPENGWVKSSVAKGHFKRVAAEVAPPDESPKAPDESPKAPDESKTPDAPAAPAHPATQQGKGKGKSTPAASGEPDTETKGKG